MFAALMWIPHCKSACLKEESPTEWHLHSEHIVFVTMPLQVQGFCVFVLWYIWQIYRLYI